MAPPCVTGCNGSKEDKADPRKCKRMLSNRESARRARMKKQKKLDDLFAETNRLKAENNKVLDTLNVVTELCSNMESENSVLVAQMSELNHRLQALTDIASYISFNKLSTAAGFYGQAYEQQQMIYGDDFLELGSC